MVNINLGFELLFSTLTMATGPQQFHRHYGSDNRKPAELVSATRPRRGVICARGALDPHICPSQKELQLKTFFSLCSHLISHDLSRLSESKWIGQEKEYDIAEILWPEKDFHHWTDSRKSSHSERIQKMKYKRSYHCNSIYTNFTAPSKIHS